ncbi:uncharacterized protein METZ01_LOCUS103828 [marine metagenome]|uniref:ATP-grasp domain-containing protein n=1 Tax=marine metagenome TaxID=408172 RepID=A0A381WET3_9ZZZZ
MAWDQSPARKIIDQVRIERRSALTPLECQGICNCYNIPVPREGIAHSADEAVRMAEEIGYPVILKIVSPDILHKTDAGGVLADLTEADQIEQGYGTILKNAQAYKADAQIVGVQVQEMVPAEQEVIIGGMTDPSFGKLIAFGLGGILVEVLKDITFRLAPVTLEEANTMIDSIKTAEILHGVRGGDAVDRDALAAIIQNVSQLLHDIPEIVEMDLNPVFAGKNGATAVDVRILVDFTEKETVFRPSQDDIITAMNRIMKPDAVAVIGASAEEGKIGNSVMKNLINGGYEGEILPVNPKADEILGLKCYRSVLDIPGKVDIAVFAIPAKFVTQTLEEVGEKGVAGAIMIPSGFAEVGEAELQREMVTVARKHNIRVMGPNIYGFYYTPQNLCATFCTPYDYKGGAALSSQSGGVGMAIIGFSRTAKMGVSAIVGLGNKSDLDEDDLLTFFEQDENTQVIAMHVEDLKDGRTFAEVAGRVSKKKPIVVLKAGRTAAGARAAASHTGALAGNAKVYEDILQASGVIQARNLNDMLQFARGLPILPAPEGENIVIITGAGGSGVLLSDACVEYGLNLMRMPQDLDAAFREFIPPFGAAGNPVDITGGEPPSTYQNTIKLGLEDDRIHALILGYWHTIVTPPMVFATLVAETVAEAKEKGIHKPIVASLVGDVEVEEAAEYLYDRGIVAYPYRTELPVAVLGAKYAWSRAAGLLS